MKNIAIIGEVTVDIVSIVEEMPKSDFDINLTNTYERINGFGYNCAKFFNAINYPYTWITSIGQGLYGQTVLKEVKDLKPTYIQKDSFNGSMMTFVDGQGNTSPLVVPGAEQQFTKDEWAKLDEEYEAIIFSGTTYVDDVDYSKLNGQLYYVPMTKGVLLEQDKLDHIFSLKPIVVLTEAELWHLAKQQSFDVAQAAKWLNKKTHNSVIVYMHDNSIYYDDGSDSFLLPGKENEHKDYSGAIEGFVSAFISAKISEISLDYCLDFAQDVAIKITESYDTTTNDSEYLRNRLKELIMK